MLAFTSLSCDALFLTPFHSSEDAFNRILLPQNIFYLIFLPVFLCLRIS